MVVGADNEGSDLRNAAFVDLGRRQRHSSRARYGQPDLIDQLAERIAGALLQAIKATSFQIDQRSRLDIAIPGISLRV